MYNDKYEYYYKRLYFLELFFTIHVSIDSVLFQCLKLTLIGSYTLNVPNISVIEMYK